MQMIRHNINVLLKNKGLNGIIFFVLGLLVALGPTYLFRVCVPDKNGFPQCHWSAQAEIGIGVLVSVLSIGIIIFEDRKICFGLVIGVFFLGILALCIPHILIGGCAMLSMSCRKTAFPFISLVSIVLLVYSLINAVFLIGRRKAEDA
jgi:hypothetical protein